jgi:hypothetical protein
MRNHLKELLNKLHYHEATDRTHMICNIIDTHLIQHPVFKVEKEYAKKVEEATMLLAEAYQIIGNISHNK